MSFNLNERFYQSDFHDHIELFYSAAKRKVGGNTGRRTQSKKSESSTYKTNKEQTIVFHNGKSSENAINFLIKKKESQERSLRRTRAEMTRFYNTRLYGHHVRFVTLTYAEAPQSEKEARNDLYTCIDRLSKATGKTIHWLAVPEHGSKNGRFHWHLLLNCSYIRNEEFQSQYWRKGFVKLERVKNKKGYTPDEAALFYIMKYIQKDFAESGTWKHRYFRSRGHKVTQHINAYECHTADFEKFCNYVETQRFILIKKESWKDLELGLCIRCHYVRRKEDHIFRVGIHSFFLDFRLLFVSPDSYNFVALPELDKYDVAELEDFPVPLSLVATPAIKKKFYDKAFSTEEWLHMLKMWWHLKYGEKRVSQTYIDGIKYENHVTVQFFNALSTHETFEDYIFHLLQRLELGHHNIIAA